MPVVGCIDILNMHSVKMHSLGLAQRRNAKNMTLRKNFERKFFSLYFTLYGSTYDSKQLSLASPSRNKASFMEKSAFRKNGLILQSSVRNPESTIQLHYVS